MSRSKDQWLKETGGFPLRALLFARLATLSKPPARPKGPRVAFDIETDPISRAFQTARTPLQKAKAAPVASLACAYSSSTKRYTFYKPEELPLLLELLQQATEVVSFNGEAFDLYVLAKALSVHPKTVVLPQSSDLYRIVKEATGVASSLNNLAMVNLGEKKHTAGSEIPRLDSAAIKVACKSDVSQTYRLYSLYNQGELRVPLLPLTRKHYSKMYFRGVCPACGDVASIVEMTRDLEGMTDGQKYHYDSGEFGTLRCTTCGRYFIWGDDA